MVSTLLFFQCSGNVHYVILTYLCRCTVLVGVPTMFVDMLRAMEAGEHAPDSLEVSLIGGSILASDTITRIKTLLGDHRICVSLAAISYAEIIIRARQEAPPPPPPPLGYCQIIESNRMYWARN